MVLQYLLERDTLREDPLSGQQTFQRITGDSVGLTISSSIHSSYLTF